MGLTNKEEMIKLCKKMIEIHSKSKSVFAEINKKIWILKLQNWESLNK